MTDEATRIACADDAPHAWSVAAALHWAGVTASAGLTRQEAARRLARHGPNELDQPDPDPAWRRFARHLREPVILLLLGAAAISTALGESLDAAAIVVIVVVNAVLAFIQEGRAQRALATLRSLAQPRAVVLRDGELAEIDAAAIVPGDIVALDAGDLIPADVRLVATTSFRTQEAALTGESVPVDKDSEQELPPATPLAERGNLAFFGTMAVHGKATALVVHTGMRTELGRIAGMLRVAQPRLTPMQARLRVLGRNLSLLCIAIAIGLAAWYLIAGEALGEVLVRSIGLAVAAVPEGLPAVVAIALALGMHRLVRANALMLRMSSVETLGSVDVVCTDKTGTLTRNEMEVSEVRTATASFVAAWRGTPSRLRLENARDAGPHPALTRALEIGRHCNNARLQPTGDPRAPWKALGDPTEVALLVAAHGADLPIEPAPGERIVFEVPFDSDRRRMSVAVRKGDATTVYVKGAAETILDCSTRLLRDGEQVPLGDDDRKRLFGIATELGSRGLRVLAVAYREGPATPDDAERDLVFTALVGMRDPPRDEVPAAIRSCRTAGIRPVMITGDHPGTALAIARDIGLADANARAVTGADLDAWSDEQWHETVDDVAVFARTTAGHKLRLVRTLQARGHVVAMTGDGVNDAPALREADIGIAMGRSGTAVTRQAADLVLLDDNFATIVAAVREGRGIFENIQRFVHFLLATNASEVLFVVLAAVLAWPPPFTALDLLWINLVTDGLPALALGIEPIAASVLLQRPRGRELGVVTRTDAIRIAALGALTASIAAAAFSWGMGEDTATARTMALTTLVHCQLLLAFAFRSRTKAAVQLGLWSNPQLLVCVAMAAALHATVLLVPAVRELFSLVALSTGQWLVTVGCGLVPVTIVETGKLLRSRWAHAHLEEG